MLIKKYLGSEQKKDVVIDSDLTEYMQISSN